MIMIYFCFIFQDVIHVAPTPNTVSNPQIAPRVTNQLPLPTGDNKYTQNMVPGYTGTVLTCICKFRTIVKAF